MIRAVAAPAKVPSGERWVHEVNGYRVQLHIANAVENPTTPPNDSAVTRPDLPSPSALANRRGRDRSPMLRRVD